jgi:dihydropyrimidinase
MSTLIKNGRIITAEQDYTADIFIEKETVSLIGKDLNIEADAVLDATGKYVIPGGIDVHTHLDMPFGGTTSADDFETGTKAAAYGGTTSLIDFAIQTKGKSLREGFETWMQKAEGKAAIDYSFHMIITDLPDSRLPEINEMVNEGITSFKLFLAYPNVLMVDDATIFKAMKKSAETGSLVCMHAENGNVIDLIVKQMVEEGKLAPKYHAFSRPAAAEGEATNRAIALAEMAGTPVYIVHLTCNDALTKVKEARERGLPAFAETCPQYLYLSIDDISKPGFEGAKYVFSPPVREKWHQEKLWSGIRNNDLQVVSTDHCPFNFKGQKDLGKNDFTKIPNGGPGLENRLQLTFQGGVNEGRFSLNRWVELNSTNPAKIFGLYPKKGTIAVGSDADIVLWDPAVEHILSAETHHMNCDYSMYEGIKIKGNADTVLSRGEVIVFEKEFKGKAGRGNFVKRKTFGSAWNY